MQSRSKVVVINGKSFQVRRLPPEVGSFIFMRMLGISMRSARENAPSTAAPVTEELPKEEQKPLTGEMKVRALAFAVFAGGISFEDFKFIQTACMKCVGIVEERDGRDFPMPVMTDEGQWTPNGEGIAYDSGFLMKLTQEVLVFCFANFFEENNPGL